MQRAPETGGGLARPLRRPAISINLSEHPAGRVHVVPPLDLCPSQIRTRGRGHRGGPAHVRGQALDRGRERLGTAERIEGDVTYDIERGDDQTRPAHHVACGRGMRFEDRNPGQAGRELMGVNPPYP